MDPIRVYVDSCVLIGATSLEDKEDVQKICKEFFENVRKRNKSRSKPQLKIVLSGSALGEFLIKCLETENLDLIKHAMEELYSLIDGLWILAPRDRTFEKKKYKIIEELNTKNIEFLREVMSKFEMDQEIRETATDLMRILQPSDAHILAHAIVDKKAKYFVTIDKNILENRDYINKIRKEKGYKSLEIIEPGPCDF